MSPRRNRRFQHRYWQAFRRTRPKLDRCLRGPTIEQLESRWLLAGWSLGTSTSGSTGLPLLVESPDSFRAGDYVLTSTGASAGGDQATLTTSSTGIGISSLSPDDNPNGFDPGEAWYFEWDRPGQLTEIYFDAFTGTATLTASGRIPVLISEDAVREGRWRPTEPIQFGTDELFQLAVVSHGPRAPQGGWRVAGLRVLAADSFTRGGSFQLADQRTTAARPYDPFRAPIPSQPSYVITGGSSAD